MNHCKSFLWTGAAQPGKRNVHSRDRTLGRHRLHHHLCLRHRPAAHARHPQLARGRRLVSQSGSLLAVQEQRGGEAQGGGRRRWGRGIWGGRRGGGRGGHLPVWLSCDTQVIESIRAQKNFNKEHLFSSDVQPALSTLQKHSLHYVHPRCGTANSILTF